MVLVGDPRQLPATVTSERAAQAGLGRSLFERLERAGHEVVMLNVQYRMHPEIRQFPSDMFYQGKLIDAPSITAELARTLSSNNNNSYSNHNSYHNNNNNNNHHNSFSTTDVSMDVATASMDMATDVATDVSMGVSVDHSTTHLLHPPHSAPCQEQPPSEPPTTPRFGGMRAFPRTTTATTTTTTTTNTMTSFSHPHQSSTITPALIPTAVTATSTTAITSTSTASITTMATHGPRNQPVPPTRPGPHPTTVLDQGTHPVNVVHCAFLTNYDLRPGECW